MAQVSTKSSAGTSGTMDLAQSAVSNPSQCHAFARQAFKNNANWSDPAKVCSRYPDQTVEVMASDFYKEMGNKAGVNHVDSFTVKCGGLPVWDHGLKVVQHTL